MRQVTAMIQVHSHHFISRSEHCKLHCHIRLCPGVRLHIDIFTAKQLFRTLNRQILCHIYTLASAIITFSRIPFRIFVRERTSHLSCHLCLNRFCNFRIFFSYFFKIIHRIFLHSLPLLRRFIHVTQQSNSCPIIPYPA